MVVVIVITGTYSLLTLNRESFPEVSLDMVTIKTVYPGGSSQECESLISIPIEKELKPVSGIDKVWTYNIENVSYIVIYLEEGRSDKKKIVQDIKDAVEKVNDLPQGVEKPTVEEIKIDKTELIYAAITPKQQNVSYKTLREAADDIEDFVYDIDGVATIEKLGYYNREYHVEVEPSVLHAYQIDLGRIAGVLAARNMDMPGGSITVGKNEYILRTKSAYNRIEEIMDTVVQSNFMENATRVKDIAKVYESVKDPDILERVNGKSAIVLVIWKKKSADEIALADRLKEKYKKFNLRDSDKVDVTFFNDSSENTRKDINSVLINALTGFLLLAFILFLSMGFRIATLVTAGLPLAFFIAFAGIKAIGLTINVVSLFGLIMVLGMIVDFSIVVSENAHRYMQQGYSKIDSIKSGIHEVFWPVTVTLLSIVATFIPLLMVTGLIGKFVKAIPIVLIISLISSWYIAFFILPTFLLMFLPEEETNNAIVAVESEEHVFDRGVFGYFQKLYAIILKMALRNRYVTIVILLFLFFASAASIPYIGFVLVPGGGEKNIEIKTTLPRTRSLEENALQMREIEKVIMTLPSDELRTLQTRIGIHQPHFAEPKPGQGSHKSHFFLYLTDESERNRIATNIAEGIRQELDQKKNEGAIESDLIYEVKVVKIGPPLGKPVNIEIRGNDFETLINVASKYEKALKSMDGVRDVSIDLEEGKTEYQYTINNIKASSAGISALDAANGLYGAFEGLDATTIKEGEENVKVRVRYPRQLSQSREILNHVYITGSAGGLVPLHLITKVKEATGFAAINRLNYRRVVQVQATVDPAVTTGFAVNRRLSREFKLIEEENPDISVNYGGEQEETSKSLYQLAILFLAAIFVIYLILILFFGSLSIPAVIMSAIPFSLVGVVIALLVHGETFSFMSVLGMFSLAGVIVSNTLVLVQFIQDRLNTGKNLMDSLVEGGVIRLKPIFLTTATTVLGLFPTIYGIGDKNYFVSPLALAFGYGLIFATFITLILIPVMLYILDDFHGLLKKTTSNFLNIRSRRSIMFQFPWIKNVHTIVRNTTKSKKIF